MTTLHAQPYDITATGFYFESAEAYRRKAAALRNGFGAPVEEFEIQFIDGDALDCALAAAIGLNQANFAAYLECIKAWQEWEKLLIVIAVDECGYAFDPDAAPDSYGIDLCDVDSLRELAEQFVEDGLLGEIPEPLRFYIDYDAFARDLAVEYTQTKIAGQRLVYRTS